MGTAGGGVWKTTDGDNSWSSISDGYFGGSIGAVAVAPSDPNVLYASDKAGAVDVTFDPNNHRILYASTWQMKRNGYRMDSGGPSRLITQ